LYTELAWIYDRIYPQIFSYYDMFDLIDGLLKSHKCRRIIEVACGTGRLMAILEENGYEVAGLDLSQEMLYIARGRCRGELLRQNMRDIRVGEPFDALICMEGSFGYMLTDEDVDRALGSFNEALHDGGILIFDCFDAERRRHDFGKWREVVFECDDVKVTKRSRSSDFKESDGTWIVDWEYVIEAEDGARVVEDRAMLRSFYKDDLVRALKEKGFQTISVLPHGNLIFQAEKVR
jgi:SAM-dependent methyltransferase